MNNSRLFLYAALAFIGLLIWQQWQMEYGPKPITVTDKQAPSAQLKTQAQATHKAGDDLPELTQTSASMDNNVQAAASKTTRKGKLVTVITDEIEAKINTRGGVIESVKLKNYPVDIKHPHQYLELIHHHPDSIYVIQDGLRSNDSPAPTHYDLFTSAKDVYKMDAGAKVLKVPFVWEKDGIKVVKTYEFTRGDYLIKLQQRIENHASKDWKGIQYRQLQRSKPVKKTRFLYTYTGAVVYNDDVKYEKVKFDNMDKDPLRLQSKGGWIAMLEHYFLSAWIARPDETNLMYSLTNSKRSPNTYTIGMKSEPMTVAAGSQGSFDSELFVGPKIVDRLQQIAPGLDLTVDYGALTFISKPLYWILAFFSKLTGNWGVSIILLTVLVKAVFFKLSEKSFTSMARMRKVSPRLQALKARYGDDRAALNKAMMELYKTEKINPLGGCLPIAVQMPVFIGLYWALLEAVSLRQAPFMLWIQDLSVPDPYYVLPVIYGISLLIQQKLSPTPTTDPIQAKMMMALPLVFSVFFAFFPAGLVLYWISNNTLTIAQQWIITKRIEAGEDKK